MKKLLLIVMCVLCPTFVYADVISIRADPWCPYNCDPKDERSGFMVEIAKFTKKESSWKFTDIDSLSTQKLGVITGYGYYEELDAYIQKNKKSVQGVPGDYALKSNITKLIKNRITVYVEDLMVMSYALKQGNQSSLIKNAGCVKHSDSIHFSFSKVRQKSQQYADILSDGIAKLRASGELQQILDLYGIQDWK